MTIYFAFTNESNGTAGEMGVLFYDRCDTIFLHTEQKARFAKVNQVIATGIPTWTKYLLGGHADIALIDKVDAGHVVLHEKFDDVDRRDAIKKMLLLAVGNYRRENR